jgi:hypothetical protein
MFTANLAVPQGQLLQSLLGQFPYQFSLETTSRIFGKHTPQVSAGLSVILTAIALPQMEGMANMMKRRVRKANEEVILEVQKNRQTDSFKEDNMTLM